MNVREVMSAPVATCSVDGRLNQAAQVMWESDCGSVPLVDGEGRLVGIVTDRDLCMAAYTQGQRFDEIPLRTTMASQLLVCHIADSVDTAERLMREGQVRRVPVIDNDGRPVGMISVADLTRALEKGKPTSGRGIMDAITAIGTSRSTLEREPAPVDA
jgi:CBS domain-containing protein